MQNCYENYTGNDLGAVYYSDHTAFRLWAPAADEVTLCLYKAGDGDCLIKEEKMTNSVQGTWIAEIDGDLNGTYYTYKVCNKGITKETSDPYAKAVGVNGVRSMVIDLRTTDPEGFENDKGPVYSNVTDIVVTEISVADTTADKSAGAKYPGKYLGLTERGTKNADGMATGLDHIKELGVTHVQILPVFDFASIDEAHPEVEQYNWGYDPLNYNAPEGSYSTDPFHGEVRIRELKEMVKAFHDEKIGVIMDVVYNHTFDVDGSCFQKTVPDYYYRKDGDRYSDASACGNEIASEKPMVRKYIIDSLVYWASEYHFDGFRFDLMGVLDIETMNLARKALEKVNPDIIMYGEGWTGGSSTLPDEKRALKVNVSKLDRIGVFSDDIRDTTKGHVFYEKEKGFANGETGKENDMRFCLTGAIRHDEVDYDAYKYTASGAYSAKPQDIVNYVSCHDNLTLWDKLTISCPDDSKDELLAMNRLSAASIFMAQGIPFFLMGEEFARTKPIEGTDEVSENSYNLPIFTNSLKYDSLSENKELFEYYKGLISFRKAHKGLRLSTAEEVRKQIRFIDVDAKNVVAFTIENEDEKLFICLNANKESVEITLPDSAEWKVQIIDKKSGTKDLKTIKNQTEISGISCLAAYC